MANESKITALTNLILAWGNAHNCQVMVTQQPNTCIIDIGIYKAGYMYVVALSMLEIEQAQSWPLLLNNVLYEGLKNIQQQAIADGHPLAPDVPNPDGTYGSLEYSNETPFSGQQPAGAGMPISLYAINKTLNKYINWGDGEHDLVPTAKPPLGPPPPYGEPDVIDDTIKPPKPMSMSDLYAGKGQKYAKARHKAIDKSWVELKNSLAKAKAKTLSEAPKTIFDESWAKLAEMKKIDEAKHALAEIEQLKIKLADQLSKIPQAEPFVDPSNANS